jgi:hypothetical protein
MTLVLHTMRSNRRRSHSIGYDKTDEAKSVYPTKVEGRHVWSDRD